MSDASLSYQKLDYDVFARTRPADDLWGQVRRTENGQPIPEEQIQMIVAKIRHSLILQDSDVVLDLACGNGALSQLLFPFCAELLGVDLSEYMIDIANAHFASPPQRRFLHQDASAYLRDEAQPERFTKALCYGSFSYLTEEQALSALGDLRERFVNVERIFIGNLPDLDRAHEFYKIKPAGAGEMSDASSQIGIWRSHDDFKRLAQAAGWQIEISLMPADFFSAHYRYDVALYR